MLEKIEELGPTVDELQLCEGHWEGKQSSLQDEDSSQLHIRHSTESSVD